MKKCDKLRQRLAELRYINVPNINSAADCLFVKKLTNGLFLFLGVTFSRYVKESFTGSFYLSKITIFSAVWDDIPPSSYRRISTLLSEDERPLFLTEEYCNPGMVDGWWNLDDTASVANFRNTVDLTEPRFLNQDRLFESIDESIEIRKLDELSEKVVIKIVQDKGDVNKLLKVQKNKIGAEWVEIAEATLSAANENITDQLVKRLASDAWRKTLIRKTC
ncbi:calponin homology domain-containing protein [Sphingobacterium endophyticum]|uniref:hypothetical protein n=1 Tax=Sphingobacterium endophyticum TaxID=2546448 RepID=UPI0012E2A11E|nr:hypothetical protein [Sphingobacterium endophyticum]